MDAKEVVIVLLLVPMEVVDSLQDLVIATSMVVNRNNHTEDRCWAKRGTTTWVNQVSTTPSEVTDSSAAAPSTLAPSSNWIRSEFEHLV